MIACDYQTQGWVDGHEGTRVRLVQMKTELALLQSARGPEFLRSVSRNHAGFGSAARHMAEARSICQKRIAECEKELAGGAA